MKCITIQCDVTDENKVALRKEKNTIIRVIDNKIETFEIYGTQFEMDMKEEFYLKDLPKKYESTDEDFKKRFLEVLKYTPYLQPDSIIVRRNGK